MTEHDIRTAFGETPASFRDQVDRTLMQLEDEPMKKRYKFTTVFALAALITVLLAGAAFAATQWKTFDFLQITPLDGAESLMHKNLGSVEDEYFRLDIEEAIFDGEGLIAQFRITPKQPDLCNLETGYGHRLTFNEDKPYVFVHITTAFDNSVLGPDGLDSWVYESDGDSIIAYASHFGPPIDDSLRLNVTLHYLLPGNTIDDKLHIAVDLTNDAELRRYDIINDPNEQEYVGLNEKGFELIRGSFSYSDALGYYEIEILCDRDPDEIFPYRERMDQNFELLRHTNDTFTMRRCICAKQETEDPGIWRYYEKGIMQPFAPYYSDDMPALSLESAILSMRSEPEDIYQSIPVYIAPAE